MVVQGVRTGKVRHSVALGDPERGRAVALAFSADGRTLAVSRLVRVDQEGRSVDVVDVGTGRKTRTLDGVGGYGIALGGSGDDLVLATTSGDRANLSDGTMAPGALGTVELGAVAFSPDGKTLAAAEPNGVALWNAEGTRRVGRLPGPAGTSDAGVSRLRFSAAVTGSSAWWGANGSRSGTCAPSSRWAVSFPVSRVHRAKSLTRAEWEQNVPDAPYRKVCG